MSVLPMDVDTHDEEVEVPSSSTSKGDKKRFEVKKVCCYSEFTLVALYSRKCILLVMFFYTHFICLRLAELLSS